MGILALIAEFENDIRRERQIDGIAKAKERGVRFGRKARLVRETLSQIRKVRMPARSLEARWSVAPARDHLRPASSLAMPATR
jgi:DNA invertase Pin-like site-specific DNA recombinase